MIVRSWWHRIVDHKGQSSPGGRRPAGGRRPRRRTPTLETLEDRTVPSFLPAVTFPVGVRPEAITVADVNGDGVQDIAVVNQGTFPTFASSLSVLLGNGDGSFQPAVTTPIRPGGGFGNRQSVAVGDVNGDGLPDVAVAASAFNAVEVLLGNGDGSFQKDHLVMGVGQGPTSLAVGDFDGNGALDLVTANSGSNTLSLLLGNGNGSFQNVIDLPVGAQPVAVAVHDVNGDGLPDLVSADSASSAVSVLLGNGDGTFAPAQSFAASDGSVAPSNVAVGDVNGDGLADLVLLEVAPGTKGLDTRLGVLLGNGDGTFQDPIVGGTQSALIGLALGDFNNDGLTDAALAESQSGF